MYESQKYEKVPKNRSLKQQIECTCTVKPYFTRYLLTLWVNSSLWQLLESFI